jgi:hypothetical protein
VKWNTTLFLLFATTRCWKVKRKTRLSACGMNHEQASCESLAFSVDCVNSNPSITRHATMRKCRFLIAAFFFFL